MPRIAMISCNSLYFCRISCTARAVSVVLLPDDVRLQNPGGGFQRVNGRVNALLGDLPAKNRGRVQMGEGRGRGGVSQVVRRDVNRLHGRDGAVLWWR